MIIDLADRGRSLTEGNEMNEGADVKARRPESPEGKFEGDEAKEERMDVVGIAGGEKKMSTSDGFGWPYGLARLWLPKSATIWMSAIVRPQLRATHGVQHRTMKQLIALLIAMVHRRSFLFLSLLLVPSLTTMAAAQTNDFNTQLKNVADKIRAKTVAWKTPEADLAPELKELDAIYAPA